MWNVPIQRFFLLPILTIKIWTEKHLIFLQQGLVKLDTSHVWCVRPREEVTRRLFMIYNVLDTPNQELHVVLDLECAQLTDKRQHCVIEPLDISKQPSRCITEPAQLDGLSLLDKDVLSTHKQRSEGMNGGLGVPLSLLQDCNCAFATKTIQNNLVGSHAPLSFDRYCSERFGLKRCQPGWHLQRRTKSPCCVGGHRFSCAWTKTAEGHLLAHVVKSGIGITDLIEPNIEVPMNIQIEV